MKRCLRTELLAPSTTGRATSIARTPSSRRFRARASSSTARRRRRTPRSPRPARELRLANGVGAARQVRRRVREPLLDLRRHRHRALHVVSVMHLVASQVKTRHPRASGDPAFSGRCTWHDGSPLSRARQSVPFRNSGKPEIGCAGTTTSGNNLDIRSEIISLLFYEWSMLMAISITAASRALTWPMKRQNDHRIWAQDWLFISNRWLAEIETNINDQIGHQWDCPGRC